MDPWREEPEDEKLWSQTPEDIQLEVKNLCGRVIESVSAIFPNRHMFVTTSI